MKKEIEADILEIQKLLYPRKNIIVSHYNSKQNGEFINTKNHLINLLNYIHFYQSNNRIIKL